MTIKDHAAEVVVVCAGCGCSLCEGQKFRSMYLTIIGISLLCHDNKKCILAAALSIKSPIGRFEAIEQARWLITAEQREQRRLS